MSCNGYVGADLEALCREAAMSAVQRSNAIVENDDMWCITMDDWKLARTIVGPSITRGVTVEIPKVSWDDIGGLNDLKVGIFEERTFTFCLSGIFVDCRGGCKYVT